MEQQGVVELVKQTFKEWQEDKAERLAAALAYYTIFSMAPLLLISITVAGLVFGEAAARGEVLAQIEGVVGPEAARMIATALESTREQGAGIIALVIGVATLLWSASNVFGQLQDALNLIWEVQPNPEGGVMAFIKKRLLSMTLVLGIGFLLLVSLIISAVLSALDNFVVDVVPGGTLVWQGVNAAVSFAVVTLLFAAIYKVLPDAEIRWRDVWVGALATALLFTVGKLLIGLYLGRASVGSTYGAAGSLIVILVWVYYSAQILFLGAEFTQVYARRRGTQIVPADGAIPLTERVREQQGLPHEETRRELAKLQHRREESLAARHDQRGGAGSPVKMGATGLAGFAAGLLVGTRIGHHDGAEHAHARDHDRPAA